MRYLKTLAVLLIALILPLACEASPIVLINVKGEIDAAQSALVRRALNDAPQIGAAAVIIELDTFGGLVDAGVKIRDMISGSTLPTICYIKNRAWSAGALIAIAHKQIAIAPGGSIGAAEPIPATEKNIAALKAEFSATANKSGRNPAVAEAMVDKLVGLPGYAQHGQILALADYQAVALGYADVVAENRSAVLSYYGFQGSDIVEYSQSWRDKASGWLSETTTKSLLISIIFLAILTEIKTAGTGLAAIIGLIAALLFFFAQWWTGFAGWLELSLFMGGILLILFELFTPGVGIFGLVGVGCIFGSIFLALGASSSALSIISTSLIIAAIIFLIIIRFLPSSKMWSKLVLKDAETIEAGFVSSDDLKNYIGKDGIAISPLRPAGIIVVDGIQLNVVSEGQYIDQTAKVRVVSVSGNRIIVKLIDNKVEVG